MRHPSPSSSAHVQAQGAWIQGQRLSRQGRWSDAARRFEHALRLQPRDALYALNLADAELKSGRPEQAAAAAAAARRAEPGNALALVFLGNALLSMNRHEALVELLAAAPETAAMPELSALLAQAQLSTGNAQAAIGTCMAALAQRPADAAGHLRLGQAFKALGLRHEAAECFRTALLLDLGPRRVAVQDLLAFYERELCDWRGGPTQVQALRESIAQLPDDAAVETNPFAIVTLLDDPLQQRRGVSACARHIQGLVHPLPPRPLLPRERLRIGYVSADFHGHATGYLMAELFERHDRRRVEVFLYSHGPDDGSPTRARLRSGCEHFVEAREMGARALAERIRADGVDILVDLKGYTHDARPMVLAHRPAPLQVAWLGFPGTTGAPWIDYLIGDPIVTPLAHAAHFSEKLAQLPECYQPNDGTRPLPQAPTRASQGLPEDALVLCGFNQPYKISPEVFDTWCRLLRRLPQAVLWLLPGSAQVLPALRQEAAARGVDPARLVFADNLPQAAHLDRLACADLFLDTWPCNGHTTASDMLWAGVPVLTFSGRSFASRVAGSLLHAVGLPELVCHDEATYEALAFELACNAQRRRAIAERLDAARRHSPLFSSGRLAPQLEALYERMWARARAGLPAEHLPAQHLPVEHVPLSQRPPEPVPAGLAA